MSATPNDPYAPLVRRALALADEHDRLIADRIAELEDENEGLRSVLRIVHAAAGSALTGGDL